MTPAPPFHLGYRRNLDGVRGLAILLVLINHSTLLGDGFGFVGVNTFFVLSGFLITCLLTEEYEKSGRISFRDFYMRRALRLLPALVTMLIAFVIFVFLTDPHKRAVRELHEALFALFYFSNWAGILRIGRHISLAHTWSLSVEEQFYIVWPLILLLLLRSTKRSSAACWICLGAFLSVLLRVALFVGGTTTLSGNVFPLDTHRLIAGTDTRADSLLLGCLAGILMSSNLLPRQTWFKRTLAALAIVSGIGLLALGPFRAESDSMITFGWLLASVFGMGFVLHAACASDKVTSLLLGNRPLVYLGQISYGLYIWHFPILKALQQHHLPWENLLYLLPVSAVVLFSYYVIERPCLRLKKRFQRTDGATVAREEKSEMAPAGN